MSRLHLALIFAFGLLCAHAQQATNAAPGSTAADPSSTSSPADPSTSTGDVSPSTGSPAPMTTSPMTTGMKAPSAGNVIRFINAIEGQTLTFTTNNAGVFTLSYKEVSEYVEVSAQSVTVISVTNAEGISLTATSLLIQLNGYTTVAAQYNAQGAFDLFEFAETFPSTPAANSGNAWFRVISLGGRVGGISIASEGQAIFTTVTNLQGTNFAAIPPTTSSIWIYQSGGMIANTYPLDLEGGFVANGVYTIFWFTPQNGAAGGDLVFDRMRAGSSSVTTGQNGGSMATTGTVNNDGSNDNSGDDGVDVTIDSTNTEDSFATKAQISFALGVLALLTL
eukprot:TRINITY_DN151_c0_g1_i1.p1 TRINITY_DN151_c0_g1~~TRINITY_DN151_c0_g1_i1.p1  ORF type:complete len:336 (+),score=83.88 TRINITY_DN151_c0_g1_i1:115-1122(+)